MDRMSTALSTLPLAMGDWRHLMLTLTDSYLDSGPNCTLYPDASPDHGFNPGPTH